MEVLLSCVILDESILCFYTGRFLVVQPCSTVSVCCYMVPLQNVELSEFWFSAHVCDFLDPVCR